MKIHALLFLTALTACGAHEAKDEANSSADYAYAEKTMVAEEMPPSTEPTEVDAKISGELPDVVVPKLIRTADVRFQVENLDKSTEAIDKIVKEKGAYISTSNLSSTNSEANNTITIRVPNSDFDPLLKSICKESIYMQRKNVSTQDVTEEYIDIEARLKTKKEVEARYIQILKDKAKTVEDVLKAEEQLRVIREEIEAREGRLNYLKNQVNYSTITVQLYQQVEYHEDPQELTESFGSKAGDGFGQGWDIIKNLIIGLITIWPLLIVALVIWYLVRRSLKARKR